MFRDHLGRDYLKMKRHPQSCNEESYIEYRLKRVISLENMELLLEETQKKLNKILFLCDYDQVSEVHLATTFRHHRYGQHCREYFDSRPPASLEPSFSFPPRAVWRIRRDLIRQIEYGIIEIKILHRWLVNDRWDSLREFMFMSSGAMSSSHLILNLQELSMDLKKLIARFLYY